MISDSGFGIRDQVDVRTPIEEQVDDVGMTFARGHDERAAVSAEHGVDVCPGVEQPGKPIDVPSLRGAEQRPIKRRRAAWLHRLGDVRQPRALQGAAGDGDGLKRRQRHDGNRHDGSGCDNRRQTQAFPALTRVEERRHVGLVFFVAAPQITALFTRDPLVTPYAVGCLRTVSLGFVFYAAGMVLTQAFNGAGDTWTPTVINLVVFWLWEIPLAWWLSTRTSLGARGVFIALTVAYSTLAVVSAILFRRGTWKQKRI